jgi:RimJ/RimL family protein N-acetyltransferase
MAQFDLLPTLQSETILIRPMREDDWQSLFAVAADKEAWAQHPGWDRYREPVFRAYFEAKLASGGMLVLINRSDGDVIGTSSYRYDPSFPNEIEIGSTFIGRSYWGSGANRDVKRLMVGYALGLMDSVVFRVSATNHRSRKAMEKIGAILTDRTEEWEFHGTIVPHVLYQFTRHSFRMSPLNA